MTSRGREEERRDVNCKEYPNDAKFKAIRDVTQSCCEDVSIGKKCSKEEKKGSVTNTSVLCCTHQTNAKQAMLASTL